MTLPAETRLDRVRAAFGAEYEIVRLLGEGGMASVYLARERALKRLVAIKVLDPDLGVSPGFRARFQREAELAAGLQHPHIVPIYRVGEADGLSYFTMAYIEGESLADRLKAEGRLPIAEAVRIGRETAAALAAAHRRGIIHRDVKPQNILLEGDSGRVMVTDFGIARVSDPAAAIEGEQLTGVGMVMGTPRYMSPEQASGTRELTPASDLYALGVILYEAITGAFPYKLSNTTPNYMVAHVTQQPVPVVARQGDVPEDLERTILKLLAKEPADRFATGEEVVEALSGASPATGRTPARGLPPRRKRFMIVALALAAVLIGGAVVALNRSGPEKGIDPRRSILIGFFSNTRQDPSLDWLRVGGVELLAQWLSRWEDVQVVDAERLLDLTRRAELDESAQLSQNDVIGLAKQAGVWTATTGSIFPRAGDSLDITVKVYDVAQGRLLSTETVTTAASADLTLAFRELAGRILQLAGADAGALSGAEPPTHSIEAYRAYVAGIEARSRWDIARAESSFARAVERDSTFALAWYELSQAISNRQFAAGETEFIAYADRAARLAAERPERERLLLEAYQDFLHARFGEAKQTYRELLARDSTIADAWAGLAAAEQMDRTVLRDSRGRDSLSGSFTEALRAYRRALALDGTDHRLYLYLGGILGSLSLESEARLPGFRQAPTGDITTAYYRLPDEYFIPLLVGEDSVVLVDSDSLATTFAGPEIDSMRSRARRAGLEVVREWLSVAPEEGTAHFLDAQLMRADRRYDEAIAAYARAERYGVATTTPFPLFRLDLLLEASRLADAGRLADSIAASPRALDSAFVASGYSLAQPFANALYMLGRIGEASRIEQKQDSSILARAQAPEIRRFQAVNAATRPLRIAMASGRLTPDLVASVEREVQRQLDAAPEAEQRRLTPVSLSFAAAMLGDTGRARRWAANIPQSRAVATLALANAVAGNQRAAGVLYAEAVRDTMRDTRHYWGLARTAELLGRAEEALSYYTHLDSARLVLTSGPDWLFRARAYAARGALLEAKGDRPGALAAYQRFLGLWRDADPELMEERRAVERAVAELERGERR